MSLTAPCASLASRQGPLVNGRLRNVSKARAEPSRDWPATCGELPTTIKLRPVDRVSADPCVRSVAHTHAHTYRPVTTCRSEGALSARVSHQPAALGIAHPMRACSQRAAA